MSGASLDEEEPVMNYEQAMKEISVNELAQGGRGWWVWLAY